jgi:hypothetical protein
MPARTLTTARGRGMISVLDIYWATNLLLDRHGVRGAPPDPDVMRHQWRRGLHQPRRWRQLDRPSAAARRHVGLGAGARLGSNA